MKRKILSFILIFTIIVSAFFCFPTNTLADTKDFYCNYYHPNDNKSKFEFTIYSYNEVNNTFYGHVMIQETDLNISRNTDVVGNINWKNENYVCSLKFDAKWFISTFDVNLDIDIFPLEGKAYVNGGGGLLIYNDYLLEGSVNKFYEPKNSYSESDMKLCMNLSKIMYGQETNYKTYSSLRKFVTEDIKQALNVVDDKIIAKNYDNDYNPDNVAFAILNRKTGNDTLDIIVVIRGTYRDEWVSNTEITGTEYNSSKYTHYGFENGEKSIMASVKNYYNSYNDKFENINLIITGHSRGAAVANLYAKDATDVMNGKSNSDSIPCFDKVTAYTFACPNVEKVTDNNTVDKMRSYNNIYNFWFESDIVPTVPLTSPADGWNYWKYGRAYVMKLSSSYTDADGKKVFNGPINKNILKEESIAFYQWPSVEDYYNKPILSTDLNHSITLYKYLHDVTNLLGYTNKRLGVFALGGLVSCPYLSPLLMFGVLNFSTIKTSHDYNTYNDIINIYGNSLFYEYSYNDIFEDTAIYTENTLSNIIYNSDEAEALKQLALIDGNVERLGWDLSDLSTWSGVTWNDDGHVISLDFTYKWLTGSFDFSVFSQLQNLNLYANSLKEIKLNNDSLTMLNCSFNDLSENSLDLSNCGNLTELYCDGCSLSTLDVRAVPKLEVLSCSFNNLISLNIENNSKLNHISCPYNYLDMHEGGVISTLLNKYKTENNAYVNSKPQLLPSDAVTDSDELVALEAFAKIGDNNSSLDWLDNNGDISIDKLQNNACFDYDGEKYRISAIDISDMNVEGKLDLSAFDELSAVYCENTGVSSLVLTNCTKVETIDCRCSKISKLILPSNIKNDTSRLNEIDCEYNYIDTKIFTNDIINHIKSNEYYILNYINQRGDSSALQAAVSYGESLKEADYSKNSFAQLNEILCECKSYDYDNLYLTQADIDSLTTDILTKIYNLKAFLNAKISAKNGIVKVFYDETELEDSSLTNSGGVIELPPDTEGFTVSDGSDTFSVLFGTTVTLTATPKEGYNFVGWFDSSSNRHISTENPYTFRVAANVDIKAVFASDGDAALTFLTPSNQVITTISKFPAEWAEVGTINDLLPDVPFKYGCKNGRWEYDEADVLSKLRSGENVNIVSAYDKGEFTVPSARNAEGKPALDLYYKYDDESGIGSFIMTTGFPENIKVESVGIAYYFKAADSFNPKDYILTLNNKVRTSKFGMDKLYDYYIMNMKNINDRNNWSVRGYVAYYDSNDNLQVEYSNQINIINNIVDRSTVSNDNSATQLPPDVI